MKTETNGKKHLLNVVDHYSRITFVKGLQHKDDAGIAILDIIEKAGSKTTKFQADYGGEFQNKILEQLRSKGICMKLSHGTAKPIQRSKEQIEQ
jgi:hypothetical protein